MKSAQENFSAAVQNVLIETASMLAHATPLQRPLDKVTNLNPPLPPHQLADSGKH